MKLQGIIIKGHGVASGRNLIDQMGTIERQKSYFLARGLDLSHCFNGTINVDIKPLTVARINADLYFEAVDWNKNIGHENFSLVHCVIWFNGASSAGYIYYPDPQPKPGHFHSSSTLELIAPKIKHITNGLPIEIEVNGQSIAVNNGT